jgi:RNA-directed DNA polymerase
MKHGQEKSDLFIVAMKPANKPGRLGAELVEPRERTKGNTGEQHTCRTLSRVSVSRGLIVYEELPVSFFVSHPRWEPSA